MTKLKQLIVFRAAKRVSKASGEFKARCVVQIRLEYLVK